MKHGLLAVILAGGLLAACTNATLVSGNAPTTIGNAITVIPAIGWSRFGEGTSEVWTVDGPLLEQLRFMAGLADGDTAIIPSPDKNPTFATSGLDTDKAPRFRKGMILPEVKEFFEGVLAFADAQRPKVENIRPEPFAGQPGFAFDFSFTSKNGLDFKGFGRGTIKNDKLYLVTYHGTRLRYFDMYRKDAETVIGSARFL
jgi:hypothetical protein